MRKVRTVSFVNRGLLDDRAGSETPETIVDSRPAPKMVTVKTTVRRCLKRVTSESSGLEGQAILEITLRRARGVMRSIMLLDCSGFFAFQGCRASYRRLVEDTSKPRMHTSKWGVEKLKSRIHCELCCDDCNVN